MSCTRTSTISWRGLVLAGLVLSMALPTWAQDEDDGLEGIDSIVVTITKRDETLQEVASTIAAFDSRTIESASIENVGDLIGLLPNVQAKGESADLSIRGVSRAAFDSQSPVAQHVNGVYKFRSESYLGQFYDLESIQIALGPSGTLYGRNATAGAMDIRWKRPHDQYEVFGDASYGAPYDNWIFRGGVNIPVFGPGDDTLMLRMVGVREVRDGTVENLIGTKRNSFGSKDDTAFRGSLLWNVSEDLSVEVRGKYVDNSKAWQGGPLSDPSTIPRGALPTGPPLGTLTVDWLEGSQQFHTGLGSAFIPFAPQPVQQALGFAIATCNGTYAPPPPACGGLLPIGPLTRSPEFVTAGLPIPQGEQDVNTRIMDLGNGDVEVFGWDMTIDYAMQDLPVLGDVALTILGGFERVENEGLSDSDGTELGALDTRSSALPDRWYTAEVRLDSQNESWLNWTVGFFYLHQTVSRERNTLTPLTVSGASLTQTEEGFAFFGNVRVNPIEDVELTAGVRWNHDSVDRFEVSNPTPFDPTGSMLDGSNVFRETTIDLGARWFINDDHMVYAKWARGYKAGYVQLNPSPTGPATVNTVKPESILATEIGWKATWLDGRLNTNLSAFHYDYKNQQVPIILALSIPNLNADEVTTWGVELEVLANITEEWFARLAVGYLNSEYDKFCSVDPLGNPFGVTTFDAACAQTAGSTVPRPTDLSGFTPEDSPEWKVSILTSYEFDLGENGTITPTLEFTWTDESYRRPFNTSLDEIDSYTKTDLRIRWRSADEAYFVEVFGDNLENEIVYPRVIVVAITGTATNFGLLKPRTYGVRFGFNWMGGE